MNAAKCPACNQEVVVNQLGGLVLHHQLDGAICPGYVGPVAALKDVAAAVGAIAMTTAKPKRGQRKKEAENKWAHTDASPEMLAAERAMLDERPSGAGNELVMVGRATAGTSTPAPPVQRKRRSAALYLVLAATAPVFETEAAAREEIERRLTGTAAGTCVLYQVRPISTFQWRIQEMRPRRVRKPKA